MMRRQPEQHRMQVHVLVGQRMLGHREVLQKAGATARQRRQQGFDITQHHRTDRTGFKAGALDAAMPQAMTGSETASSGAIVPATMPPRSRRIRTISPARSG